MQANDFEHLTEDVRYSIIGGHATDALGAVG